MKSLQSEIPELNDYFWENARLDTLRRKESVSWEIDEDVLAWFRNLGKGYQSHVNALLRHYISAQLHSESN